MFGWSRRRRSPGARSFARIHPPAPRLSIDRRVTLYVSDGPETAQVPPVVGLTQGAAEQAIINKGFIPVVVRVDVPAGSNDAGKVISQDPRRQRQAGEGHRGPDQRRRRCGDDHDGADDHHHDHDGTDHHCDHDDLDALTVVVRASEPGPGQAGAEQRSTKLASRSLPAVVSTDSGWNCTPSTSSSR